MARSYCPTPDDCRAKASGICSCQMNELARRRMSETQKKTWADPEKLSRRSEAIKKAWADPEVRRRRSETQKKTWADPELLRRHSETIKKALAAKRIPIPDHLKSYAKKLRRNGIRGEALRKALEAFT